MRWEIMDPESRHVRLRLLYRTLSRKQKIVTRSISGLTQVSWFAQPHLISTFSALRYKKRGERTLRTSIGKWKRKEGVGGLRGFGGPYREVQFVVYGDVNKYLSVYTESCPFPLTVGRCRRRDRSKSVTQWVKSLYNETSYYNNSERFCQILVDKMASFLILPVNL